jgi:hypothetical protein
MAAAVTDMSGIASVTFQLGGRSFTDTAAPYEWSSPAPWIESEGDVTLVVTAADAWGNQSQATRVIRVRPQTAGNPPAVALTCPTPGALAAAGTSLDFYATASKDNGIDRVELLLGTDPVALSADYEAPYVVRLTVPAGTAAGQVLQVKVRARGYDGVTAEVVYPVTVIAGSVLTADRTLAPADLSLDNQTLIVAGGTLTVQGAHRFTNLVVLDGAKVTHLQTTTSQAYSLDLAVDDQVYIACGGRIDVSDLGYREASAPPGLTPASGWANGGNHGGAGGSGEFYDSVYQPWLPGAGGTAGGSLPGWPGGGVVLLDAATVVLDGAIRARGQDACGGAGGAGGTVRIRTSGALRGAGQIDASGGVAKRANCSNAGNAGGGGRVALHVGSFAGFNPVVQVNVQGGTGGVGSAGTLLTRTLVQTWGDLRVDQRSTSGAPITSVLPSVGRGIIGATYPGSDPADLWIEPQSTSVKFSLGVAGVWVRINGVDYLIRELSADRRRVLLQGAAGAVTVGQRYLGIYKFDSLTVTGWTRLELKDGDVIPGAVTVASGSILTRIDGNPPVLAVTQPAAGTLYTSGATITVTATATDASGVSSVTFRLGAQSFTDTSAPYQWTVTAPAVQAETDMTLVVSALDVPTNEIAVTRTIRVLPPAAPVPPAESTSLAPSAPSLALTCPSPGALLAPGTGLDLRVVAQHEDGIERVELLLGSDPRPLATDFVAPYELHFTAPTDAPAGEVLQVKIRAYGSGGGIAETVYPVKVVEGRVIAADATLSAADRSLDGQSVVVAGGTLTIQGWHGFKDLAVLDGARIIHSDTTAAQVHTLDLGIEGDLWVGCGGSFDVTGRGSRGTAAGPRARGPVGGSHGGRGGRFDGTSPAYGNLFDPREPGAGGGVSGAINGHDGGGVLRLTVLGDAVIDGLLRANGEAGLSGGGAGGSISLHARTLLGAGHIQADGGGSGSAAAGGGGGGRIALYAGTIDAGLLSRTTAAGAGSGSPDVASQGAAGTVFVRRDTERFGELIVDNAGTVTTQLTDLPEIADGVVDAVGETGFTDRDAEFRRGLAGLEVAFGDDLSNLFLIEGRSRDGHTLLLRVPRPPLSALVRPGDTYRGVYRFDRVTVRGGARLELRETNEVGTWNVDSTSTVIQNVP